MGDFGLESGYQIRDSSSDRLLLHIVLCLLCTVLCLVFSILRSEWSLRKKGCCHSGRTRVELKLLLGSSVFLPLLSTTCIQMSKLLVFFHVILFLKSVSWDSCSLRCSLCPSRILNWGWFRHLSKPFHTNCLIFLTSWCRLVMKLIFLCRGTCIYQWWVLLLWRCWDCWQHDHRQLHMSRILWGWRRNIHCFWCTDKLKLKTVDWYQLLWRSRWEWQGELWQDISYWILILVSIY